MASYSHFESNLWIENGTLAEFGRVLFDERFKESVPLISVGGPVESVVHVFAYGLVGAFRMEIRPRVCKIDPRPLYSQEVFHSGNKSLKGSLTWAIRNRPVIRRVNKLRRFLRKKGTFVSRWHSAFRGNVEHTL